MKRTPLLTALAVIGVLVLVVLICKTWFPEDYADWKNLTFHEPAHYIFEFQNEAIVALVLLPCWQRAKRNAVERAIRVHDAKFHPHSHKSFDSDDQTVVG